MKTMSVGDDLIKRRRIHKRILKFLSIIDKYIFFFSYKLLNFKKIQIKLHCNLSTTHSKKKK